MYRTFLICAAFALAGCTQTQEPPSIRPTFTDPQAKTDIDRYDVVNIRTFEQTGFRRSELQGLNCTLSGAGYRTIFQSPNRVALPVYRGRTNPATLSCQRPTPTGSQTATTLIEATNITADAADEGIRVSTGTGGTSVRVGVSIRDRSRDRFDYPASIGLTFK